MAGRAAATVVLGLLMTAASPVRAACTMSSFALPVRMQGMAPIVSATVNGHAIDLLLDSGSFFNGIGAKFAAEQKLPPFHVPTTGSRIGEAGSANISGVAGSSVASPVVRARSFVLGGTDFRNAIFFTFEELDGGILGQNFLKNFDVEYDLRRNVMKLLVDRGCAGANLAYWANGPYAMLPLDKSEEDDHTVAIVLVNGAKMRAMFDTGASGTFITRRAAARAGVNVTDAQVRPVDPVRGIDRRNVKAWSARFATVKIGDEEIRNGRLTIGDSEATGFDLLLGADFFLSHHVLVANSQGLIYFTFNGGHAFGTGASSERRPPTADPAPR